MSPPGRELRFVVSCEHGGNEVPPPYRPLFRDAGELLESHRGWDPGARGLARFLAGRLGAELHAATTTRLLVDLNRSPGHPRVFSEITRSLPALEREGLLARHHAPYREDVRRSVVEELEAGHGVAHLSVHSFTPMLDGRERPTDLGLLYDPARPGERALAQEWARELRRRLPHRRVHRNRPYRGVSDGLTTWLRRCVPSPRYLGMEVEVSQRWLEEDGFPAWIGEALAGALEEVATGWTRSAEERRAGPGDRRGRDRPDEAGGAPSAPCP